MSFTYLLCLVVACRGLEKAAVESLRRRCRWNGSTRVTCSCAALCLACDRIQSYLRNYAVQVYFPRRPLKDDAAVALEDAAGGNLVNSHLAPWQPRRRHARAGKVQGIPIWHDGDGR